jgi:hypothetical protein
MNTIERYTTKGITKTKHFLNANGLKLEITTSAWIPRG